MTDRELLTQALEALENLATYDSRPSNIWTYFYASATGDYVNLWEFKEKAKPAITALRERLALSYQPKVWMQCPECKKKSPMPDPDHREWVGLTEEEIKTLPQWFPSHDTAAVMPLIRAIEAKLKEKNS